MVTDTTSGLIKNIELIISYYLLQIDLIDQYQINVSFLTP